MLIVNLLSNVFSAIVRHKSFLGLNPVYPNTGNEGLITVHPGSKPKYDTILNKKRINVLKNAV